jgi:EmrB/QacA subfamily drug resistance transporter
MLGATRPPCDAGVIRTTAVSPSMLSRQRKRMTLAATILGSSMAFIDGSVVNVALPAIQQALQAGAVATQWIINAYLLLLGSLVLVGGSAADLYGRRRIFVLGVALFTLASIGCGLAPNVTVLIISRAIQGIGAAILTPASLAILGTTFDEHERSKAIGLWAGFSALTSAAGPVLGGWLVDNVSWRAIFLLNVPLAMAATALAITFACESRDPQARRLDWRGAIAVAVSLAAITWGIGAISRPEFRASYVIGVLGVGAVLFLLFIVIERRAQGRAMMPLSLYRSREFSGTNALTLLLYFALGGALYFLPFGLIRLGGYSATQAGAALLPFALIMGLGASVAGAVADRFGPRLPLTIGPLIAGGGLALLALADLTGSYWSSVFPAISILAFGMMVTVPALTSTVMASVAQAHAGVASGVNNAVARVASLLAVAILGAVLFLSFSNHVSGIAPAQMSDALNAVMSGHADVAKDGPVAFERGLRTVMWLSAICAGFGGCIGWLSIEAKDAPRAPGHP